MEPESYRAILGQMRPGERLLWVGRPRQGVYLPEVSGGACLTALILLVIQVLFISLAIFKEFYAGFFITGFFLFAVGRKFIATTVVDPFRRRSLVYGLTDRSAIVVNTSGNRSVQCVRMVTMTELKLRTHGHLAGTIYCLSVADHWHRRNKKGVFRSIPIFRIIVGAPHVYHLMRETVDRATPPAE